ncbi:MAG: UPF0182 family protein [Bacillota bacterium]
MYRRGNWIWVIVGILAAIAAAFVWTSSFFTDWLWFKSIGFGSIFSTVLLSRLTVGIVTGLVFAVFLFVNLWLAKGRSWLSIGNVIELYTGHSLLSRGLTWLSLAISLVIGVLAGLSASGSWLVWRSYLQQQPFGVTDPIFGRDISFYLFSYPLFSQVYTTLLNLVFITGLAVVAIYVLTRAISFGVGGLSVEPRARRHLAVLIGAGLLVKAFGYRLAVFRLLYSPRGVVFGASYTDIHAQLLALKVLFFVALAVAALAFSNLVFRNLRPVLYGLTGLIAISLVLGTGYPAFVQQFTVEPNEVVKESPYIAHNIAMTRLAYGLDAVRESHFVVQDMLTPEILQENAGTLNNIRLWDHRVLTSAYDQLQEFKPYYDFLEPSIDRYVINGVYRQVAIAPRELNQERLPENAKTWVNRHLFYTHGYGVVVSPSREATAEGQPLLWVRDIPSLSPVGLNVTRPQIYFGRLTKGYVIVGGGQREFDYPSGNDNAYTTFDAETGVSLRSPLVQLAFALRFGDYRMLLSDNVSTVSQLLMYRQIDQRVARIAPFLRFTPDPYVVIDSAGRLVWMIDGYTTSHFFPYSEPTALMDGINYVRNSVKVTVDAYTGETIFYLFDESDPLIQTYARIFPDLFRPYAEMPDDLKAHIRYPIDLFNVQATMYATYHMTDPTVFYNKEDQWILSQTNVDGQIAQSEPYNVIMRLPGEEREEFVSILPFSPVGKANMIGWGAVRSDAPNYGEIIIYRFPKTTLVYGPSQVDARINQDADISKELTLWGQRGSAVIRGTLLVIPVERSLLYVQPLYLQSTGTRLPELKRVIVAYSDRVVMRTSLDEALRAIFEGRTVPTVPGPGPGEQTVKELATRARELLDLADSRARAGDWAGYGAALEELAGVLRRLEELTGR